MTQEELHPSISHRPGTRPTIEQHWANIEAWAKDTESASDHVLLDLRDRVRFLESRLTKDIAHQLHQDLLQLNDPEIPDGSLVERVAEAIGDAESEGLTNMTWRYHARAAIREVAAWLREHNINGSAAALEKRVDQ